MESAPGRRSPNRNAPGLEVVQDVTYFLAQGLKGLEEGLDVDGRLGADRPPDDRPDLDHLGGVDVEAGALESLAGGCGEHDLTATRHIRNVDATASHLLNRGISAGS